MKLDVVGMVFFSYCAFVWECSFCFFDIVLYPYLLFRIIIEFLVKVSDRFGSK